MLSINLFEEISFSSPCRNTLSDRLPQLLRFPQKFIRVFNLEGLVRHGKWSLIALIFFQSPSPVKTLCRDKMDNIQELFTYPTVQQGQAQQAGPPTSTPSYTTLSGPKEIYASNIHNLNVQPFNYDPNTQWISMPVINSATQAQSVGQIQQVRCHHVQVQCVMFGWWFNDKSEKRLICD